MTGAQFAGGVYRPQGFVKVNWELAACKGRGDVLWDFDESWSRPREELHARAGACRAVCAGCPIIQGCREYALANDEHGFWGGMTKRERRRWQSDRRRARVREKV